MLKWLAAQGFSPAGISAMRRGFEAGRMKDEHIAALIEYAAVGSKSKPREARCWGCRYCSDSGRYGPGLKGVHQMHTPGKTHS